MLARRSATRTARTVLLAATCIVAVSCSSSPSAHLVGGVEAPPGPTLALPVSTFPNETVVVWAPPVTTAPSGTATPTTVWAELEAAELVVKQLLNVDGGLGFTASNTVSGDLIEPIVAQMDKTLFFPAPVELQVVYGTELTKTQCDDLGVSHPCANLGFAIKSKGEVVSQVIGSTLVKKDGKWLISARTACGFLAYFRAPCPVKVQAPPSEAGLLPSTTAKP